MKKIISRSITADKASLRAALLHSREQQAGRAENVSRESRENGIIDKLKEIRHKSQDSARN